MDNTSLLYGAGTLSPDQEMGKGNYALASHRATNPELLFTPLENSTKKLQNLVFYFKKTRVE
ncbi:hypothetical protein EfmAA242_06960 [Enterococcus faecium]|nr:hypothetical protein EfmAA242_06960 [Enterococcus faecium]